MTSRGDRTLSTDESFLRRIAALTMTACQNIDRIAQEVYGPVCNAVHQLIIPDGSRSYLMNQTPPVFLAVA